MTTHSHPTDLLPLVGLGAEQPWPRGAARLDLAGCVAGRELWSASSDDGERFSVMTFAAEPSPDELAELERVAAGLGDLGDVPGVVRVLEANVRRGYLRLEPIVGILHDLPALGLKLERKLELFRGLAAVVIELHSRGRSHGGLCPGVVGLDEDLGPRLLDPGGQAPASMETRLYAAPEVLDGGGGDARSDVYSLGRLLAFLLLAADPPLETALVPHLDCLARAPAGLSRIVRRATCVEPLLRYSSVEALLRDVERYGDYENVGLLLPNAAEQNFTGLSTPPGTPPRAALPPPVPAPEPPSGRRHLGMATAFASVGLCALATLFTSPVTSANRWLARRELERAAPAERGAAVGRLLALGDRDLGGVSFEGADLSGATLSFADLAMAKLGGANLNRADLAGANLDGASVSSVSALGADWSGAKLDGAVGLESVRCDDETLPPEGWECRAGLFTKEAP